VEEIPFLPISFFKNHPISSRAQPVETYFESSGTTGGPTSKLFVHDELFYKRNAEFIFERFFGPLSEYSFFFLLPSYLERRNSSLVSMAHYFHEKSNTEYGGFYLHNLVDLKKDLRVALQSMKSKIVLWGVTFALLDFASLDFASDNEGDFHDLWIVETGGMKGRGREPVREEVHSYLKGRLGVSHIYSEYGMTELFSQAYSLEGDLFTMPSTMKILIREPEDPLSVHQQVMVRGGINVIDLANVDSCSFIETQDVGLLHASNNFQVLGRFDNSDIRGCNLMVQ
jgi:hypothetical protein